MTFLLNIKICASSDPQETTYGIIASAGVCATKQRAEQKMQVKIGLLERSFALFRSAYFSRTRARGRKIIPYVVFVNVGSDANVGFQYKRHLSAQKIQSL
jgi:hypothetical protein